MEKLADFLMLMARVMLAERIDGFGIIRCRVNPAKPADDIFAYQRMTPLYSFLPRYVRLTGEISYDEVSASPDTDIYGVRLASFVAGAFKGLSSRCRCAPSCEGIGVSRAAHFARLLNEIEADRIYLAYQNDQERVCGYGFCIRRLIEGERVHSARAFKGIVHYRAGYVTCNPGFDAKDEYWYSLGESKPNNTEAYDSAIRATGRDPQTGIGRSYYRKAMQDPMEGITCHHYR